MNDSLDIAVDNHEAIELNGNLNDLVNTIKTLFDEEIKTEEAKFIIGVLVEKKNADQNKPLERKTAKEFGEWVESKAADAGYNTRFGTFIIQTSIDKLEAIHAVYSFFFQCLIFQNPQTPINYLGIFSIELIWFLVMSIRLVTEPDEKAVMAVFIEKNAGVSKPAISYEELEKSLRDRCRDTLGQDECNEGKENASELDEKRIRVALGSLVGKGILKFLGGDYWQFG